MQNSPAKINTKSIIRDKVGKVSGSHTGLLVIGKQDRDFHRVLSWRKKPFRKIDLVAVWEAD